MRGLLAAVAILTAWSLLAGCSMSLDIMAKAAMDQFGGGTGGGALDTSKIPAEYVPWIMKAGSFCDDAPPLIVAAVIKAENDDWNPNANRGKPKAAYGLVQFTEGTWHDRGVDGDGDGKADIWNPADAIISAGRYLCAIAKHVRELLKKPGGIPGLKGQGNVQNLMIVGYNKGIGIWETTVWNHQPIHFDSEGIPDNGDGNGTTGQEYLRMVNDKITELTVHGGGQMITGSGRQAMVTAAKSQIGVREWVGRLGQKNCNPYGPCEEWCALFASWVWNKGGIKFHSAGVIDFYNYGGRHHTRGTDFSQALPGDTIVYGRSVHIGVIVRSWPNGDVETIEGNSQNQVFHHPRRRPPSTAVFVRPVTGT